MGFLDILIESLKSNDTNIICVALEALKNIFKKGEEVKLDFQGYFFN